MKVVNNEGVEFVVGERYNWKNQNERLIYMGIKSYPGNGWWYQFALVENPSVCWSEVRKHELNMFERTQPETPQDEVIESKPDQPGNVHDVSDALLGMGCTIDLSGTASGLLAIKSMDDQNPTNTNSHKLDFSKLEADRDTELVTLRLPAAIIAMFNEVATQLGVADYQVIMQRVLTNHCENHLVK